MTWWFAVAERDHQLQNPTSEDKVRLLGEYLELDSDSRVLDLAAGKAGPALVLASTFGCRIVAVEQAREFVAAARERVAAAGLAHLIEIHEADAREFAPEREGFQAALCLGASFVWSGLEGTLRALRPAVHPGGYVVVGEPYWRRWPLDAGVDDEGFVTLVETAARFRAADLRVEALIASSEDDWDRYESLHWRAVEEWLDENPTAPEADEFRRDLDAYRDRYLAFQRELLGWAIFAGRRLR